MEKGKLMDILKVMEGVTFLEWKKLKMSIDTYFLTETRKQNNSFPLTDSEKIVDEYRN